MPCLELLQKMAYAATDDEYTGLYMQFQTSAPKEVLNYFNKGWYPIKSEWVLGLKSSCGSFLNATNNWLECINDKLKQVINHHSIPLKILTSYAAGLLCLSNLNWFLK